jgi:hypothetical protein
VTTILLALLCPQSPGAIPEDRSLTVDEYVSRGVPAPDRPWSAQDYAAAIRVLRTIAAKDVLQMPRHESRTSGALFRRMCDKENLEPFKDRRLPIEQRLPALEPVQLALRELLVIYLKPAASGAAFDRENLEVMGMMLRLIPVQFALADEFLATLPKDDPKKEVRREAVASMRKGAATSVDGALLTLGQGKAYRASDLVRFAALVKESLPAALPSLPPDAQKEVPVRLQRLIEAEADPDLKAALKDLLAAVAPK